MTELFWTTLDAWVEECQVVIDRPRSSPHPRYPDIIYPLDYGYLKGTTASDGEGIDVWVGGDGAAVVTGVFGTVDAVKRDAEIKILLGCTEMDAQTIACFYQQHAVGFVWLRRPPVSSEGV